MGTIKTGRLTPNGNIGIILEPDGHAPATVEVSPETALAFADDLRHAWDTGAHCLDARDAALLLRLADALERGDIGSFDSVAGVNILDVEDLRAMARGEQ
jgi:hypothetical protein